MNYGDEVALHLANWSILDQKMPGWDKKDPLDWPLDWELLGDSLDLRDNKLYRLTYILGQELLHIGQGKAHIFHPSELAQLTTYLDLIFDILGLILVILLFS